MKKRFVISIAILLVLIITPALQAQTQTILEGQWTDRYDFAMFLHNPRRPDQPTRFSAWEFNGNRVWHGNLMPIFLVFTRVDTFLEGTFTIDEANRRFTVTNAFGDRAIYQYVLETQQSGIRRLQIRDSSGRISIFFAPPVRSAATERPAQPPANPNMIPGSNINFFNLTKANFDRIMEGTIFTVFNQALSTHNTDLRRALFLETDEAKEYLEMLDALRLLLREQGIFTIPLNMGSTTNDYISTILNYDVTRRGFNVRLNHNDFDRRNPTSPVINGFRIPNYSPTVFIPVPIEAAQRIEGNRNVRIQLQLNAGTFAIERIFLFNERTDEIYAEMDLLEAQREAQRQAEREAQQAAQREAQRQAEVTSHIDRAITYTAQENFNSAVDSATQAIRLNSNYARAYLTRGLAYFSRNQSGDLNRAIADFTEAIRLDRNNAAAYVNRGNAYIERNQSGDIDRAIADYNEAIRIDRNNVLAYTGRGIVYRNRNQSGDRDRAIADFTEAIRLDRNNAVAYNNRGILFTLWGDTDRADADFTEAIRIDQNNVLAHYVLGIHLLLARNVDQAIAHFSEVIRLDPNYKNAYSRIFNENGNFLRGTAYSWRRQSGDLDRAIEDFTESIRLDSNREAVFNSRGHALINRNQSGDIDRAIADYTEAIRLASARPDGASAVASYYTNRGNAYVRRNQSGDIDRAIADFNEAIRLNPRFAANSYISRGNAYIERNQRGDLDRAIADFTEAIRFDSGDAITASALLARGIAYRSRNQRGDLDRAIADFTEAIRLVPIFTRAFNERGTAYRARNQRGDSDRAIADFTEALRLDPTNEYARTMLERRR